MRCTARRNGLGEAGAFALRLGGGDLGDGGPRIDRIVGRAHAE